MVATADQTLQRLTDDYEVIVVNDGSQDDSAEVLAQLQHEYPCLRVITHDRNTGYGGALRSGFGAARKELVFYTDGDAQYDPAELEGLFEQLTPDVDVVQGWKIARHDAFYRKLVGRLYHHAVSLVFDLHVRDVDCDFRLFRRHVLENLGLCSDSGSITVEMVARIEQEGFRIREMPVHHFERPYGRSQFFNLGRVSQTLWQLGGLWFKLHFGSEPEAPLVSTASAPAD